MLEGTCSQGRSRQCSDLSRHVIKHRKRGKRLGACKQNLRLQPDKQRRSGACYICCGDLERIKDSPITLVCYSASPRHDSFGNTEHGRSTRRVESHRITCQVEWALDRGDRSVARDFKLFFHHKNLHVSAILGYLG